MPYVWPPTLAEVKAHLNLDPNDNSLDTELTGFVDAATVVVENITGSIASTAVTEWHSGTWEASRFTLSLRRMPVVSVDTVTAYIGNTAQAFTLAANPAAAGAYSYTVETETGTLTCRVGSGYGYPWPNGDTNISVAYHAGQSSVPANVRLGHLEVVRSLWQTTQYGGRASFGGAAADDDAPSPYDGYAVPPHVRQLLQPHRMLPGIA